MDYSYLIYIARYCFPVITAIFFFIKLLGGESSDRKHSFVLCCLCILYFLTPDLDNTLPKDIYKAAYIESIFIEILITGAGMMAMYFVALFEKSARKHALILTLIIFINFVLSWNYTVVSLPLFKEHYDELIISASILQILVSIHGISESISRVIGFFRSAQRRCIWGVTSCVLFLGNLHVRKKGEKRT